MIQGKIYLKLENIFAIKAWTGMSNKRVEIATRASGPIWYHRTANMVMICIGAIHK